MTAARLALLAFLVAGPALAQGTSEQREACTPDVMRLCSAEVPDVSLIVACLRRDRVQVSPACHQAMGPELQPEGKTETKQEAKLATPVPARARLVR